MRPQGCNPAALLIVAYSNGKIASPDLPKGATLL